MASVETAIEMFVGGLVLDPNTQAPVVILKDETGNLALPIWIGIAEATSIASAIKQVSMARPLTHDLMYDIFGKIGVRVQRVVITELRDSTYFAELVLAHGDQAFIIDSRPSDAIGIALRAAAPIFVAQQVLDQAKISFQAPPAEDAPSVTGEGEQQGEGSPEDPSSDSKDFRAIDRDKWSELLADLDPDDFKYKQ